jgi:hypothetical protein
MQYLQFLTYEHFSKPKLFPLAVYRLANVRGLEITIPELWPRLITAN